MKQKTKNKYARGKTQRAHEPRTNEDGRLDQLDQLVDLHQKADSRFHFSPAITTATTGQQRSAAMRKKD
jgi:hypothetical protein